MNNNIDTMIHYVKTAPKKRVGDVELLIQTGSGIGNLKGQSGV